ncbi:MAG: DNA-methyltransferase [Acidimicrobiales bacterium]
MATTRRATSTSTFGAGRRESHDATAFYARFTPPTISDDDHVVHPSDRPVQDSLLAGPAEVSLADDSLVKAGSVALVVTSPPYFVGKSYEEAMGQGHVPAEYEDHLANLHTVFGLCVEKLEPGGRIAVNVANLGRRPYRSQAADVIRIFEDLGLLVRGEIIWKKGEGSNGSTAWGSFQKPSNPVLRDITERVIVASKGRFDRAVPSRERAERGLPSVGSITKEAFMRDTKDVWEIAPESATRVGHPAPFPVALPGRLIELYTYYDDLVLDPYVGVGTTAVAALRTKRHYVGCETEPSYIEAAERRIAAERERLSSTEPNRIRVVVPAVKGGDADAPDSAQARAVREGRKAEEIAEAVLEGCGFTKIVKNRKLRCGVEIDFQAVAADGSLWHFDVTGSFTSERAGLRRTDSVWKSLGKAAVRRYDETVRDGPQCPFVLLTTALPAQGVGLRALRTAREQGLILDAVPMLTEAGQARLRHYGTNGLDGLEDVTGSGAGTNEFLAAGEPDGLF